MPFLLFILFDFVLYSSLCTWGEIHIFWTAGLVNLL